MPSNQGNILIVDDNSEFLIGIKMYLSPYFNRIITEKKPERIPAYLNQEDLDIILLDMNFSAGINSGNEGMYWMRKIKKQSPDVEVIFITGYGEIELAVNSIKEGASDFVTKTQDEQHILAVLMKALKQRQSNHRIQNLQQKQQHLNRDLNRNFHLVGGKSAVMRKVLDLVKRVAATEANILILGENGTGKEILARQIHQLSARSNDVFIPVDMASIPESLFESELFGHRKGAYTDANENKPGRFEIADGGTLFLDEIGNLPLNMQTKILTVLQNREVMRLGSLQQVPIDVRLISATNMPLEKMVKEGNFREDLFYRINTIQLQLPPLRERKEDIPDLVDYFLQQFANKYEKTGLCFSEEILEKFCNHNWPGNVRELQHQVEKAVILAEDMVIQENDLQLHKQDFNNFRPDTFDLAFHEKQLISQALKKFDGNMSEVARQLGITRSTLYHKIRRYDI